MTRGSIDLVATRVRLTREKGEGRREKLFFLA
jgi:hypothetical protein